MILLLLMSITHAVMGEPEPATVYFAVAMFCLVLKGAKRFIGFVLDGLDVWE